MKITFCGVRGTSVAADKVFHEFGGNTSCYLIEGAAGEMIVVDAGTGIRLASGIVEKNGREQQILLLFTHYHLDHVMGFPSFSTLYKARWSLRVAGPVLEAVGPEQAVRRLMCPPFWPVPLADLPASLDFETLTTTEGDAGSASFHGVRYRWCQVHHPAGCLAYRLDEEATGAALVLATDLEWGESTPKEREDFLRLCASPRPADVLLFDGQFTDENYARFRGWGHSRWRDAVEAAAAAGVGRLVVIHHAPGADDGRLRAIEQELARRMPQAILAKEGLTLEVRGVV